MFQNNEYESDLDKPHYDDQQRVNKKQYLQDLIIIIITIIIITTLLLSLLLLLLWLSFSVIAIITIAIFYLCYHWNNNYCYSCHHTDMTFYQNPKFFVCFCWFTFVLPPPPPKKKFFLRDHNGNKATQLFCVIPAIVPHMFFFNFCFTLQFSFWL